MTHDPLPLTYISRHLRQEIIQQMNGKELGSLKKEVNLIEDAKPVKLRQESV